MKQIAKAEIHCHVEGAAPPALTAQMAKKYQVSTEGFIGEHGYQWHDFTSFLNCYHLVSEVYRSVEDYALLTKTYLTELASVGTIYSELIVSPDHGKRIGLGADSYIQGICEGLLEARRESGIEARLIVTGERHFGVESVVEAALYAANAKNPLITGFNLAGDERMGRFADFRRAFDIARDAGLGLTVHAGEVCGPESVAEALDVIRPSRISHGVRAIEDRHLVERLSDSGVVLEICPGSNIALGVYPDFTSHPLRSLMDAGVRITLNSDDPPFFHTSLQLEYERAAKDFHFSESELEAATKTAIEAAFVDETTRARLLRRISEFQKAE